MNLDEFRQELSKNPEYLEASDKLKFRFALANAVLRARLRKGLSQAELAGAVGTKQANISKIEAGLANPTLDFIRRLCEVLGLDLMFPCCDEVKTSNSENYAETVSATLPIEAIRVDNQPENVFCPKYSIGTKNTPAEEGKLE